MKGLVSDESRLNIVLTIEGNTSPDGDSKANLLLSKNRAHRVLEYIRQRVAIPDSLIHIEADGIDWERLAELAAGDSSVPGRDKAIDILRHTPVWIFDEQGRVADGRKKQLMDMAGRSA